MEPDATPSATLLKLWAWVEANKKQAQWGALAVVGLGLLVGFLIWHRGEKVVKAGEALADAYVGQSAGPAAGPAGQAQSYLRVATEYAGYKAGVEAALLGASTLFTQGKWVEARIEFEKVAREQG